MDSYKIEWGNSARRELRRLAPSVVTRVVEAVSRLAQEPLPVGCMKLKGGDHTYRIRIGDYRVVYEVLSDRLLVVIVRVRHRRDAYR